MEVSDFTVEEKLQALYQLQKVDSKIDEINHIKGELPFEVQDLEDEIEGLEQRIKRAAAEIDEVIKSSKARKESVENSKQLIIRYETQQESVRNNREYESLSKEASYQKLEIELAEKNIKEFFAQNKLNKRALEETKGLLAERRADLVHKREELDLIESETVNEVAELTAEAKIFAARIDERTLTGYTKVRASVRNGIAVAMVKRDACSGCFNRIPPQRRLDVRMSKKLIICEYCGRILVSDLMEETV